MAAVAILKIRKIAHLCNGTTNFDGVRQRWRATVATPGEWQCKTGGVRRLAVANGPNIFRMLLVDQAMQMIVSQAITSKLRSD